MQQEYPMVVCTEKRIYKRPTWTNISSVVERNSTAMKMVVWKDIDLKQHWLLTNVRRTKVMQHRNQKRCAQYAKKSLEGPPTWNATSRTYIMNNYIYKFLYIYSTYLTQKLNYSNISASVFQIHSDDESWAKKTRKWSICSNINTNRKFHDI